VKGHDRDSRATLDGDARAIAPSPTPTTRDGHWCWRGELGAAQFAFYGKSSGGDQRDVDAALEHAGLELAWLRQVHSARVVDAEAGDCGEGDALITRRAGLALRVATADCVPVLLAARQAIAAVHAGWRGLAGGVLTAAASRLLGDGPIGAVIGPAIGVCCYEVGSEVAAAVAQRAGTAAVIRGRGGGRRPHLDLRQAARLELERAGVGEIVMLDACTRCDAERLWSYRRDGKRAGRNLALVWRSR
jgi:YfiH family protein